jgi:hypothetical protein
LFFKREAERYRLDVREPVKTRLRTPLQDQPPQRSPSAGILATVLWTTPVVPHSLGLAKGLIGVVYAFAAPEMNGANDVVIAHELLHTLGASDKYAPGNDAPRFPDGYGDPHQVPLYPQRTAELMAGRRMLSPDQWRQPESLDEVVIGPATALEIGWPLGKMSAPRLSAGR